MATDFFYQIGAERLRGRALDTLPSIGDLMVLKRYGKIRTEFFRVKQVIWHIAQDESPQYVNKPKMCIIDLEPMIDEEEGEQV